MIITVTNLTADKAISTDIGLVQPGETATRSVETDQLELISTQLVDLQTRGLISFTIREDPSIDNRFESVTRADLVTQADVTLWVDGTNGNDTWDGSQSKPLKTIQAAIDRIPGTIKHNVTINVAAGTYDEALVLTHVQVQPHLVYKILGAAFTAIAPTTGVAAGTFTSSGEWALTMTGAGWTANDLVGKFVKITSGSLSGDIYPIAGNTATTLEVPRKSIGAAATSTFELVTPSTKIAYTGTLSPFTSNFRTPSDSSLMNTLYGLIVENIEFSSTSSSKAYISAGAQARFTRCKSTGKASTGWMLAHGRVLSNFSYLSSLNSRVLDAQVSGSIVIQYVVVDNLGGTTAYVNYGIRASGSLSAQASVNDCIIQNALGTDGACIQAGQLVRVSVFGTWIRNCSTGVLGVTGAISLNINTSKIEGAAGCGIVINAAGYAGAVVLFNGTITGCGADGIRMSGNNNHVSVNTTSTISDNTGFGINLAYGGGYPQINSHSSIHVATTLTMVNNVAGDLSTDGTTATAIADLRLDADKTIVDLVRFNRMAAD